MAKSSKIFGLSAVAAFCSLIAMGSLTATPAHAEWCHLIVGPVGPDGEAGHEDYVCEGDPVVAPNYFTAIAVSDSTLSWGASWEANSRDLAEQVALANCRKHAADCKAVDWGQFKCLALAISLPDKTWGVDAGNYPETASSRALLQCRSAGGTSCKVETLPCSQD